MSTTDPERRIEEILARKADLQREIAALDAELNTYRVKCTTCRCRLLPGTSCACCAEAQIDRLLQESP